MSFLRSGSGLSSSDGGSMDDEVRLRWMKRRRWIALMLVCVATGLLVFVLPLFVRVPFYPTISASYVARFSNRVAVLAAAAISASVLLYAWLIGDDRSSVWGKMADKARLRPAFVAYTSAVSGLFFAVFGWLVVHSHLRYLSDAGYFIHQLDAHARSGRALYSQLEFAYGPLLFYPTLAVQALLHCAMPTAYFLTLMVMQSLGLFLLAYVMNELPMRGDLRKAAFVILAFSALTPLLGLNYTFFRFATPMAMLLFAMRRSTVWSTTLWLAVGEIVELAISPELGFAFLPGVFAFVVLRTWQSGWRWLYAASAPVIGAAVFLITAGKPYLYMIRSFSRGSLNLPVEPLPHILIFLFALVWLVPVALGRSLRRDASQSTRVVACYALSIGLLPAALGRCDPLHIFFNGLGMMVLSLVAISGSSKRVRIAWMICFVGSVLWAQWVNYKLYAGRTIETVRMAVMPQLPIGARNAVLAAVEKVNPALADNLRPDEEPEYQLDVTALESQVGAQAVATPVEIDLSVENELKRTHHYRSEFYCFFADVFDPVAVEKKIRELNEAQWALIPQEPDYPFLETPRGVAKVQGFVYPYADRNQVPFDPGSLFDDNLTERWQAVKNFGPYVLYKRRIP